MLQLLLFCAVMAVGLCGEWVVECPAPRSPEGGQAFLQSDGRVVKYACDPGLVLVGRETARCLEGEWEDEAPLCVERLAGAVPESTEDKPTPVAPPRELFNWGDAEEEEEEGMQGDQVRVRTVLVPGRRAQLRTGDGSKVVSLQAPPSVLYVRRTGKSSDQEPPRRVPLYTRPERAPVQVVQLPRQPAVQNDKGEENLRHMYWWAAANYYRQPSLVDGSYALTDSQIGWIYSLPPDLRDRYLRDLQVLRADELAEGERSHAFMRRYGNNYYLYHLRNQIPVDPVSLHDYSCNQAGSPFVRAPRLAGAHVARYDRRQNPNHPRNHYLTAVYACDPGHRLLDDRVAELHCSGRQWVGYRPVCLPTS